MVLGSMIGGVFGVVVFVIYMGSGVWVCVNGGMFSVELVKLEVVIV